ncbi:hypothetical protein ACPPVO_00630 [Dactylosporangium sp. McL0621]|uniref:hypothetical protein n=1 Tax=Dactylosporangium sp. McL0621 TaxID=3415678 RepID=UPI003CECCD34
MKRSRIGLLCSAVALTFVGALPPAAAVAQPTPEPSAPSAPSHQSHGDMLKGVLHGEGIVETKNGPVRVALQNGEATKVTATAVTVQSSDGFTRTWQIPKDLKVYDKRHTVQPNGVQSGTQLTIAGTAAAANATPATTAWTAKWVIMQSNGETPSSS